MREVKVITKSANEEKYYREIILSIIGRRYQKLAETKEQMGLINQEYWMRAVQQPISEETLPILTMKQDYDPKKII